MKIKEPEEIIQKNFYDKIWSKTNPTYKHIPGVPGWLTRIPNRFFIDFFKKNIRGKIKEGYMLDLGCGAGRHAIYAAKNGLYAHGIDFSKEAIRKSKQYARNEHLEGRTKFKVCNVNNLPYKNRTFDFVNDSGCFNHLQPKYWKDYAKEVHRVLKPEGIYRLKAASHKARTIWGYNPLVKNRWILQTNGQYKYYFKKEELENIFKNFEIIQLRDRFVSRKNRFYFMVAKKNQ